MTLPCRSLDVLALAGYMVASLALGVWVGGHAWAGRLVFRIKKAAARVRR